MMSQKLASRDSRLQDGEIVSPFLPASTGDRIRDELDWVITRNPERFHPRGGTNSAEQQRLETFLLREWLLPYDKAKPDG